MSNALEIVPATPARWKDLEALFGPRGACAGCWCMWWRLPLSEWKAGKGQGNKQRLQRLLKTSPTPPGLIALRDGTPVGWCALAPRSDYPRLAKSRALKPLDSEPVWSITCFFVARGFRRQGISVALLKAACRFATQHHARILEGYPIQPEGNYPDAFAYTGTVNAFSRAGFVRANSPAASRHIFRRVLAG